MTLRDLRVQTLKERKAGRLTLLSKDFYTHMNRLESQIREFIGGTKSETTKLEKAKEDIRKFSDLKLDLYKIRERKLTDLAIEKINGQNPNLKNVHENEEIYLNSMCEVIEKHREKTLLSEPTEETKELQDKPKVVKDVKLKHKKVEEKIMSEDGEYIKVKVIEDLPTFTGMDAKNYTLKNADIVRIPVYNARILNDAGKVKLMREVKA